MKRLTKTSILLLTFLPLVLYGKIRCKEEVSNPLRYCDTSAGRSVLKTGGYSQTYCRHTAMMNFQRLHGCCTWQGGVFLVKAGNVICGNGSISPICSIQETQRRKADSYKNNDNSVNINGGEFLN